MAIKWLHAYKLSALIKGYFQIPFWKIRVETFNAQVSDPSIHIYLATVVNLFKRTKMFPIVFVEDLALLTYSWWVNGFLKTYVRILVIQ